MQGRKKTLYIVVSGTALVLTILAALAGVFLLKSGSQAAKAAASPPKHINCEYEAHKCAELADGTEVFGANYTGHDEPAMLFYSNKAGSGNRTQFDLRLPK